MRRMHQFAPRRCSVSSPVPLYHSGIPCLTLPHHDATPWHARATSAASNISTDIDFTVYSRTALPAPSLQFLHTPQSLQPAQQVVMCRARLQAVGQAKPGPIRPSQARPGQTHGLVMALARPEISESQSHRLRPRLRYVIIGDRWVPVRKTTRKTTPSISNAFDFLQFSASMAYYLNSPPTADRTALFKAGNSPIFTSAVLRSCSNTCRM